MNPVKKVVHDVNGVTFVVGLKEFADDDTTVNFLLLSDKKQLCYFDFVSTALKRQGYKNYNVIVYVPNAKYDLVNPTRLVILNRIGISI